MPGKRSPHSGKSSLIREDLLRGAWSNAHEHPPVTGLPDSLARLSDDDDAREGDRTFGTLDELIDAVEDVCEKADHEDFFDTCGNGYSETITPNDWNVEIGYGMKHAQNGHGYLYLMFCHIYSHKKKHPKKGRRR